MRERGVPHHEICLLDIERLCVRLRDLVKILRTEFVTQLEQFEWYVSPFTRGGPRETLAYVMRREKKYAVIFRKRSHTSRRVDHIADHAARCCAATVLRAKLLRTR